MFAKYLLNNVCRAPDGVEAAAPSIVKLAPDQTPPPAVEPKAPETVVTDKVEPKDEGKKSTLAAEKAEPPKSEVLKGAPDKYEAFKLPEGAKIDEATLGKAQGLFKELGLPQAGAQKLIDMYSDLHKQVANSHTEAWQKTEKEWLSAIRADKEIGSGDEKILRSDVKAAISKTIDALGGDELRTALNITGAGNNPAIVKALFKASSAFVEGKHVGGEPAKPAKSAAARMYPGLAQGT